LDNSKKIPDQGSREEFGRNMERALGHERGHFSHRTTGGINGSYVTIFEEAYCVLHDQEDGSQVPFRDIIESEISRDDMTDFNQFEAEPFRALECGKILLLTKTLEIS
jgi:hypothetical protein